MRKLVWIGLILEVSPALAFLLLVVLHPVGDPQDSGNMFVRILDYQGAFWIRKAIPVPPPLLFAGVCLLFPIWLKKRSIAARNGTIAGIVFLVCWFLIMVVPFLIHVN